MVQFVCIPRPKLQFFFFLERCTAPAYLPQVYPQKHASLGRTNRNIEWLQTLQAVEIGLSQSFLGLSQKELHPI